MGVAAMVNAALMAKARPAAVAVRRLTEVWFWLLMSMSFIGLTVIPHGVHMGVRISTKRLMCTVLLL